MERGQESDDALSMAAIVAQMDAGTSGSTDTGQRVVRRGEMVEGVIASIDREGILVDIGSKSDGHVPAPEVAELLAGADPPRVGETVLAYVISTGDSEGRVIVSLREGRVERAWRTLDELGVSAGTLPARVVEANRGGLVVDALGLRGFVPLSQIATVRVQGTDSDTLQTRLIELIGTELTLRVVEVERRRNRLILSERMATQARREQDREEVLARLTPGEIRLGRVTSLTDFGAFVDIGGADGLVHLSELSWTRVARASDVVQVGDEIQVQVLSIDTERRKISLSIRRAQPEPWATAADRLAVGSIVEGTVTRLAPFGAFARLDDGLEGLIHISEMADGQVTNPRQVVAEGERRRMRILRVDPERRRLGLSLRGLDDPSPDDPSTYANYSSGDSGGGTIGDLAPGTWQQGFAEAD
jgi:small subunit ribosomal protein S1